MKNVVYFMPPKHNQLFIVEELTLSNVVHMNHVKKFEKMFNLINNGFLHRFRNLFRTFCQSEGIMMTMIKYFKKNMI